MILAYLQIYRELLSLVTFLRAHSNSEEVSYLSWQNTYSNLKTTCYIKPKFFLLTKLLENLFLAKYLISVARTITIFVESLNTPLKFMFKYLSSRKQRTKIRKPISTTNRSLQYHSILYYVDYSLILTFICFYYTLLVWLLMIHLTFPAHIGLVGASSEKK